MKGKKEKGSKKEIKYEIEKEIEKRRYHGHFSLLCTYSQKKLFCQMFF
jgi:hypothetical protein